MNESSQWLLLEEVYQLTESMLDNALNDRWSEVMEIQPKRDELIHRCFSQGTTVSEQKVIGIIERIIEFDNQLVALGIEKKGTLNAELKKLALGKGALEAYKKL